MYDPLSKKCNNCCSLQNFDFYTMMFRITANKFHIKQWIFEVDSLYIMGRENYWPFSTISSQVLCFYLLSMPFFTTRFCSWRNCHNSPSMCQQKYEKFISGYFCSSPDRDNQRPLIDPRKKKINSKVSFRTPKIDSSLVITHLSLIVLSTSRNAYKNYCILKALGSILGVHDLTN